MIFLAYRVVSNRWLIPFTTVEIQMNRPAYRLDLTAQSPVSDSYGDIRAEQVAVGTYNDTETISTLQTMVNTICLPGRSGDARRMMTRPAKNDNAKAIAKMSPHKAMAQTNSSPARPN